MYYFIYCGNNITISIHPKIIKTLPDSVLIQSQGVELEGTCPTRSEVIDRMKKWVDAAVPYSQTDTYHGYRQDCSGYVSMGWNSSKPGHTTSNMGEICTKIKKSEMLKGDVLLKPGHHVLMFHYWVDSNNKNEFWQFAEHTYGMVAMHDKTTYDYHHDEGYYPCRFNKLM